MALTYKIVRFFENLDVPNETIASGVSLEVARRHCQDPETASKTVTSEEAQRLTAERGPWFDGYRAE